jgi:S-sulfo-L-cysteine synthase (3-phospho-L-serine-dependent)
MPIDRQTRASLLDAHRPSLVGLEENLIAASFPLMKIYPACACLERAVSAGLVNPNSLVIESSSGTMALGLAMACRWHGYNLTIVSDSACDPMLQMRLGELGATVEIVAKPSEVGGYQRARLDRVDEIRRAFRETWWVNQYDNTANAEGYSSFAEQLIESVGRIGCLIGTVGSGGSVCGTSSYLRMLFPDLIVVGVDTFGSVLFGQLDGPRVLRGLGNSLLPKNLDHTAFDEVHWVSAAEAYTATRLLHSRTGLLRGGTSGACWLVARYWAARHPNCRIVCLLPDDGYRYLHTIYNDAYMGEHGLWLGELPDSPREVGNPLLAGPSWSWMNWNRQPLIDFPLSDTSRSRFAAD